MELHYRGNEFFIIRCQMIKHSNKQQRLHGDFMVRRKESLQKLTPGVLTMWEEHSDDNGKCFLYCHRSALLLAKDENFKGEGI